MSYRIRGALACRQPPCAASSCAPSLLWSADVRATELRKLGGPRGFDRERKNLALFFFI